tara:strand:- start:144 stop:485 length:342 start_codon:yes stop_codon:yes gene_type:complete
MYYLKIIILKKCPYCQDAIKILNKIKNTKIDIIEVDNKDKDKYKTEFIKSFPQIYLKKYNSKGSLLIGGYDDLKYIDETIKKRKAKSMELIKKKFKDFSKKATLRLIEIFVKN